MTTKHLIKFSLLLCFAIVLVFAVFSTRKIVAQKAKPAETPKTGTIVAESKTSPIQTPSPTPNDEDEVIKIDTEEVNLSIRVVDRTNRPISNLRQDDFHIFEDNVEQTITAFTTLEVPINYAIVIDNSGSLRTQLEKVIEASKIIVETNRKDDATAVIRFVGSDNIRLELDFTKDKGLVNDALDNLYSEGGQTAIRDAVYLAAERVSEYESEKKGVDRKRRAIILVTDGEDRNSVYNEQQLFEQLRESDVQIYTVGFVNELSKEGGFIKKSPMEQAKNFLNRLSQETGGKAYFPNSLSELSNIARDIAKDLRTQYLVSYEPSNDKKDGTFRNIKVNVNEGPNKQKRIAITRNGRIAAKDQ